MERAIYRLATAEYEKLEIFDPQGRFQAKYDDDWAFGAIQEGRLPIKQGGKWGVVDRNGHLVVKPRYDMVFNFFEGKAVVCVGGKYSYIDREGRPVLELKRGVGLDFLEGFAVVSDGDEMWFIKPDGAPAFDRRFSIAHGFSEGLAAVCDATKRFGYIDHTGKYVIEPKYDAARHFSDGLAAVTIAAESNGNGKKLAGYIDPKGKMVIRLSDALKHYSFRRGLALVQTAEWMGYIDKTGRVVWKTPKPWNLPFVEQD
ncbi:MAG: WG repeat-containing protein [Pirellulales bacterium]